MTSQKKLLFFRILSKFHQLAQGFQKWHNPNHNKNLYEGLQITEYSKTMHMIFPIVQNWTTVRSTAGSCMRRCSVVESHKLENKPGPNSSDCASSETKSAAFLWHLRLHVLPLCPNICTWRETGTRHWSCLWSVTESLKLENKSGPR